MLDKAKGPPLVATATTPKAMMSTDERSNRAAKRKLKNVWLEGGRFLFRYGPNGSTVFDTWKWMGEPLHRRHA